MCNKYVDIFFTCDILLCVDDINKEMSITLNTTDIHFFIYITDT
jgi:hypothetical protein